VSALIRDEINILDHMDDDGGDPDTTQNDLDSNSLAANSGHVELGSKQSLWSFEALEQSHSSDGAFKDFRKKLSAFLNVHLPAYKIPLPNGKPVKFQAGDSIVCIPYVITAM
jgi:hypothetical protein